ncbi:MAG TPA: flippase-like domain-containing protein, partial [Solirubrobacteraceae bacterium]|nr:flippase-like domain-containing protein [Solirubrobacteraceae bacterium]
PEELSPRHIRRGLLQLAAIGLAVVVIVLVGPGLGTLRDRLGDANPALLVVAVILELLSTLSYVVIFRSVFCAKMSWRLSYQIGMAEQGANSVLPAGGAGGLALGAWALNRGGMSAAHIGRRSVAFFLLTSLANVGTLIVFALLFATGIIHGDTNIGLTYGFAAAGLAAAAIVLLIPVIGHRRSPRPAPPPDAGRVRMLIRHVRNAIGDGVRDSLILLRRRPFGVITGSFGYMGFDIATLVVCFHAFGHAPALPIIIVAYIIGQLGGLVPLPGGIGGTEGGLIGLLALYHAPLASATVSVLAYRTLALWLPALLGSVAFVQLRTTLRYDKRAAAGCAELAAPLPVAGSSASIAHS